MANNGNIYWCYPCSKVIDPVGNVVCPECGSGFLSRVDDRADVMGGHLVRRHQNPVDDRSDVRGGHLVRRHQNPVDDRADVMGGHLVRRHQNPVDDRADVMGDLGAPPDIPPENIAFGVEGRMQMFIRGHPAAWRVLLAIFEILEKLLNFFSNRN